MHFSGSGTQDSPIAIDDSSEDESFTYSYRTYSFTPPNDLLLSPRPGTFLSTISRPRLTMPMQNIQQVKKGAIILKNTLTLDLLLIIIQNWVLESLVNARGLLLLLKVFSPFHLLVLN